MASFKENMAVYDALRNEILLAEESTTNCTLSMYISYITLFALGFNYNWIFLASFVVLIIFQALINRNCWLMVKASAYIKTFFEDEREDMHWESLHKFNGFIEVNEKQKKEFCWRIQRWGSTFLAILSFCALVFITFSKYGFYVPTLDLHYLLLALALCFITGYTNKLLLLKGDDKEIKKCMEDYKAYLIEKSNATDE